MSAQTCTFMLSAAPQSFPISGGTGTVNIVASSGTCARTATSNVSWITINFGQTGAGNGSAGFAVAANNESPSRTGTITVGSQSITITQAGPPCNFALNPNSANISALSQSGSFKLSGLAGCTWTGASNASYLQVTHSSGTGPATFNYSAQANATTTPRSGAVTVTGLTSSWIPIVSGASGLGGGVVAISADANPDSGARTGTVTAGGQIFTVTQSGPQIQISSSSIANAATYATGAVSSGLVVYVAVPGIGPAETASTELTSDNQFFTTQLGDTRVLFDGAEAPMIFAASGQFSAIVPYLVAGKDSTQVQVEYKGARSNSVTLLVVASSPGLFSIDTTRSGPGAIIGSQYNLNTASNPAPKESVVTLYATGEGQTTDPGVDGELAAAPFPTPNLPVWWLD
jgi:uncharacterized protein (TIGR03437 family)